LPNTQWRKKNAFFSNNCNFFIFSIKNYVNTKTTCNKCSFVYLHWLLNYRKLYRKDGVLLALHTSGAPPQSSASHLPTFLVAHLQFLREWKLSDRRLYEVFERRLLIWGDPKERNRRQIQKHAFFLRHPVLWLYRGAHKHYIILMQHYDWRYLRTAYSVGWDYYLTRQHMPVSASGTRTISVCTLQKFRFSCCSSHCILTSVLRWLTIHSNSHWPHNLSCPS